MDRRPDRSLSVEEAKNRLRTVTDDVLPSGYVRRHPYAVLALAFATGFIFGKSPDSRRLITRAMLKSL